MLQVEYSTDPGPLLELAEDEECFTRFVGLVKFTDSEDREGLQWLLPIEKIWRFPKSKGSNCEDDSSFALDSWSNLQRKGLSLYVKHGQCTKLCSLEVYYLA